MSSMPGYIVPHTDGVVLQIRVVPRASRNQISEVVGDRLKIRIAATPVDSAANNELIRYLSGALGVAKSRVRILRGHSGRSKNVLIEKTSVASTVSALASLHDPVRPSDSTDR